MPFVRPQIASSKLGVSLQTLRNYEKKGLIETIRTPGGQRLYDINTFTKKEVLDLDKKYICYCRVSSHSQTEDLDRQVRYMEKKYPNYEIITDIGSGINFKRKGLLKIIEYAIAGNLEVLAISFKDRLCRIGYDLLEHIFTEYSGTKIIIDKEKEDETLEDEITKDILQIMTVYTAKIHGLRSYKKGEV